MIAISCKRAVFIALSAAKVTQLGFIINAKF